MLVFSHELLDQITKRVKYAVSTDATRPHLASILFEVTNRGAAIAATDGHRLVGLRFSSKEARKIMVGDEQFKTAVPWSLLQGLMATMSQSRALTIGEDRVTTVVRDAMDLASNLPTYSIDLINAQEFPPWEQVVPSRQEFKIEIKRLAVVQALRTLKKKLGRRITRSHGTKFDFTPGSETFDLVTTKNEDTGLLTLTESVNYKSDGVKELSVGANFYYLQDAFGKSRCDAMSIELSGSLDPILIKGLELFSTGTKSISADLTCVVMPMRI